MKAHVKIDVSIHFEGTGLEDGSKYPLTQHHAGVIEVADMDEGHRAMISLANHIHSTFGQMGVQRHTPGVRTHKPDLAAAFGGLPEPVRNGDGN